MRELIYITRAKNKLIYCFTLYLLVSMHLVSAQITLDEVLVKAKGNSPFTQILSIAAQDGQLSLNNINVSYIPQIQISGQATYQSEVTSIDIPFPNIEIESPDKDQYKIVAEAQQNIYDGGMTHQRKALQKTITASKLASIELEWRRVRKSVIQLYFSILELDSKIKVLAYSKENIQSAIKTMNAAVDNGVKLPSAQKELRAGLILLLQQEIIVKSKRKLLIQQLELLQGESFDSQDNFTLPFIKKRANTIRMV